jgi:hypothetical protein
MLQIRGRLALLIGVDAAILFGLFELEAAEGGRGRTG